MSVINNWMSEANWWREMSGYSFFIDFAFFITFQSVILSLYPSCIIGSCYQMHVHLPLYALYALCFREWRYRMILPDLNARHGTRLWWGDWKSYFVFISRWFEVCSPCSSADTPHFVDHERLQDPWDWGKGRKGKGSRAQVYRNRILTNRQLSLLRRWTIFFCSPLYHQCWLGTNTKWGIHCERKKRRNKETEPMMMRGKGKRRKDKHPLHVKSPSVRNLPLHFVFLPSWIEMNRLVCVSFPFLVSLTSIPHIPFFLLVLIIIIFIFFLLPHKRLFPCFKGKTEKLLTHVILPSILKSQLSFQSPL